MQVLSTSCIVSYFSITGTCKLSNIIRLSCTSIYICIYIYIYIYIRFSPSSSYWTKVVYIPRMLVLN